MDDNDLPYFFTETLATREHLTERQRARKFTLEDLAWLDNVYLADNAARIGQPQPMHVEAIAVTPFGAPPIELAGACLLSPSPDGSVFLYTPSRGLEKFESRATVLAQLSTWLKPSEQQEALAGYLSIAQRQTLKNNDALTITVHPIVGAVFEALHRTIAYNQVDNAQQVLDELGMLPSFTSMLDQYLTEALCIRFPALDQRKTRVNSYITETTRAPNGTLTSTKRPGASRSLSVTVLDYFVANSWPVGETRQYSHPEWSTSTEQTASHTDDQLHWERAVQELAHGLKNHITQQLSTFWKSESQTGLSRLNLIAIAMADKFRAALLDQQQQNYLSPQQRLALQALPLTEKMTSSPTIKIEKTLLGSSDMTYVELAGTLVFSQQESTSNPQAILLYTQSQGFQTFNDLTRLKSYLLNMLNTVRKPDLWMGYLSRPQRYSIIDFVRLSIITAPTTEALFPGLVQSIIEKQAQNLEFALDLYRQSKGTIDINATIDNLLDVRAMIDRQLLELDAQGRWSTQLSASWHPSPPPSVLPAAQAELQKLERIDNEVNSKVATRPTLQQCAAALLNSLMANAQRGNLHASNIFLNQYPGPPSEIEGRSPTTSISMVEYFLQRLCAEAEVAPNTPHYGLFTAISAGVATKLSNLDIRTFNALIDSALKQFPDYLRRIHNIFPDLSTLFETALTGGLRGEVLLRGLNQSLLPVDQAVILEVLNSYKRDMRRSLNGFRPDAFALTLNSQELTAPVTLTGCFLLTERGGQDVLYSGRAILWTSALGLETFDSLAHAKTELTERLADADERLALIEHLAPSLQLPSHRYTLGALQLIEDNLGAHHQQTWADQKRWEQNQILGSTLSSQQLRNIWQVHITQSVPANNLKRAMAIAKALIFQQSLPQWLGMAPERDQQLHVELLEQYRNNVQDNQDYLHGIESIQSFARKKLSTLLRSIAPQSALTPDQINVTFTTSNAGAQRTVTLVNYALLHRDQRAIVPPRFTSTGAQLFSTMVDGRTLNIQLQALALGSDYQTYLKTMLGAGVPGQAERQQLFARQLPWQLLQYAHAQMLQKNLSETAFGFIQQVFDMPDAIARAAVIDTNATIRPLEFLTSAASTAIKVTGVYLISPTTGQGPHILYAPYSQSHDFKEYLDEASLLTELSRPGELQTWIFRLLGDAHQTTLTSFFVQSANTASTLRLTSNPVTGPLFNRLFTDNLEVLTMLLGCQFITNAHAHWNWVIDIFKSAIYQGVLFLAGKLAYPWIVWQSFKLFMASAENLQGHHWREAMDNFISGVAELAMLRQSMPETGEQVSRSSPETILSTPPNSTASEAVAKWPALDITAPERTELQAYALTDRALQDLNKIDRLGLYQSEQNHYYAPVEGKVVQVTKQGERWRISHGREIGPYVYKNTREQWMLSSPVPLRSARRALSRLSNRFYSSPFARQSMNIQASGMQAIRTLYPVQALMITEALTLATYYAKNARDNLRLLANAPQALTRSLTHIKKFFGLQTVETDHLIRIQFAVDLIYNALTEPSLTNAQSIRFVMGESRMTPPPGTEQVLAFTLVPDTHNIIYLTAAFFKPTLNYNNLLREPFYVNVHARAVTLIHELTHHVSGTHDIAYLESVHPYPDLIDTHTPQGRIAKAFVERSQNAPLSSNTPPNELFQVLDSTASTLIDPEGSLLHHILRVTGGQTLDDARQIFSTDPLRRVISILSNADSTALLISRLGRQLDTPPSPTGSLEWALEGNAAP
ncbi:dermonecrotic toxin domain-containing protein [Pseudomonas sp. R3-52-08]|uniref:dermonecrotic toxin domain-containing protein n=1 Tax=Pseudomonas sp. R3-52-08 TaxID=1173284 RepID=UPI000F55FE29|nr:DUF6543 domain-containing protein [Pseudomonas sp. R3-52-08]AZF20929.1 hypothetical protein C4J91_2179 [Pseudomonas sp. R3-52-08]